MDLVVGRAADELNDPSGRQRIGHGAAPFFTRQRVWLLRSRPWDGFSWSRSISSYSGSGAARRTSASWRPPNAWRLPAVMADEAGRSGPAQYGRGTRP